MKQSSIKALLEEQVDIFINNIASELEQSHSQWFENFGFPIFGETSKEYFEQLYFQSYLESYTRKTINDTLRKIFFVDVSDEIRWPELENVDVYNGFTNIECEQEFGFEFINLTQRIGYRYTHVSLDEVDNLLSIGNVDIIHIVIWKDIDDNVGFSYEDSRIKVINLWNLFTEIFCELEESEIHLMYQMFTKKLTYAIEQANSMIALTTLPRFSPLYLFKSRNETINTIKNVIESLSFFSVKNKKYKSTEQMSIKLIEEYQLPQYFLINNMEYTFIGTSKFAKCFLTSEYLYNYFKDNFMFDYTPIVSGYIKSIELLLYELCALYRNRKNEKVNIKSFTMGKYIEYIKNNEMIFRNQFRPDIKIFVECLTSYRIESRNNLFHKDFFDSWERVKQIRQNTIFLYVVLLGAADIDYLTNNNSDLLLNKLDVEYEELFYLLEKQPSNFFRITLNGKEYPEMEKIPREKGLTFNRYGQITNSIKFRKFQYDHYEFLELSRFNMPTEIWIDGISKKTKIWKKTSVE